MYKIENLETGVEPTKITTVLCVVIMLPNLSISTTIAEVEGDLIESQRSPKRRE